jgi:hypothetical protein
MASYATTQMILPKHVLEDLIRFIYEKYQKPLPNSLLIAQAFILQYPEYGKEYGLPAMNYAIEDGIIQNLF